MNTIRRRLHVSSVVFDDELRQGTMSVLQLAPLAKRLGLDGVEYRTVYWRNKKEELRTVRAQTVELGLEVTYATFTPLHNANAGDREQLLEDIEDAAALGSQHVRVYPGWDPEPGQEDAVFGAALSAIKRAVELGMVVVVENGIWIPGYKISEIQKTVERYAPLGLRVNIDTTNFVVTGEDLLEAIRVFGPLIVYSHLKDLKATNKGRTITHIGDGGPGALDYVAIMAEFDRAGRGFPHCLEFPCEGVDTEGRVAKSRAFLQSIWERLPATPKTA